MSEDKDKDKKSGPVAEAIQSKFIEDRKVFSGEKLATNPLATSLKNSFIWKLLIQEKRLLFTSTLPVDPSPQAWPFSILCN